MSLFEEAFDGVAAGERFVTRGRTITESDIATFAALTGDFHPQHTDAEWSAASPFGERIAHGMLVLSYAVGLVPFDPERVVALRGLDRAVFKRPVRIGDTIHVEGRVAETAPLDEGQGLVATEWRVVNQRGELCVRVGVDVVWKRDAVAASEAEDPPGWAARSDSPFDDLLTVSGVLPL